MLHGFGRHAKIKPLTRLTRTRIEQRHRRTVVTAHQSRNRVIFSGIQPTGVPHLGNYLGALRQWEQLQHDAAAPHSTDLLFSVVDLHAITVQQDADQLRAWKRETMAALLAIGLDPERCTIFYQSAVPQHAELMWILSCMASVGHLSRMTQWKSKLALADNASPLDTGSAKAKLKLGLFSYPVLQAADILLYGTTHVPVGEDQVQHLEFTRDCADVFNSVYGEIFTKPETILSPAKRVMSLKEPNMKMSKSHEDSRSRVHINDLPEDIATKIRLALTDSIEGVSFDPAARPGVSNLLSIMSYLDDRGRSIEEIVDDCAGMSMRTFKNEATDIIVDGLADIRARYEGLVSVDNSHYLEDIAQAGAAEARKRAVKTMAVVRQMIGI